MSNEVKPSPASDFRGRIVLYAKLSAINKASAHEQLLELIKKAGVTLSLTPHRPDAERLKDGAWLITLHPQYDKRPLDDTTFPSFQGADEFYAWVQSRKAKARVVTDVFSRDRVDLLRPLIRDIEDEFRLMLLREGIVLDETDKQHQRRSGDHVVAMLDTYRLIHGYFLGAADDSYYLEQLKDATTDEERVAARNSTRLDQLGYGEHVETLREFSEVRNIVAHNRMLPDEQFVRTYRSLTALKDDISSRRFMRMFRENAESIRGFTEAIRTMQEQVTSITQALMKAYAPINQVAETVAAIMPKLNPIIDAQIQGTQQIVQTVSKIAEAQMRLQRPSPPPGKPADTPKKPKPTPPKNPTDKPSQKPDDKLGETPTDGPTPPDQKPPKSNPPTKPF